MRKLVSAISAAAILAASPLAALAQVNENAVINSGDSVNVVSNVTNTTSVKITNNLNASVNQDVNALAVSGGNTQKGNIATGGSGVSMTTGDSLVAVQQSAQANDVVNMVNTGGGAGSVTNNEIVNTGDSLKFNANTTTSETVRVRNNLNAEVYQNCGGYGQEVFDEGNTWRCTAISGENYQGKNIGNVNMRTGNAGVAVSQDTAVNHAQNVVGTGLFPLTLAGVTNSNSVTNTGDYANLVSNVTVSTSVRLKNNLDAWIYQGVNGESISGGNDQNGNIGGVNLLTGGALVDVSQNAKANKVANAVSLGWSVFPLASSLNSTVNTGDFLNLVTNTTTADNVRVKNYGTFWNAQYLYGLSVSGENSSWNNIGNLGSGLFTGGAGTGGAQLASGNGVCNLVGGGLLGLLLGGCWNWGDLVTWL